METLTRAEIAEESRLFRKVVDNFCARILPRVAKDLTHKTSDTVSKEWTDSAFAVLNDLLLSHEAEGTQQHRELETAREELRLQLKEEIGQEIPCPSKDECLEHATELAQCIVANWVTLIRLARRNRAVRGVLELPNDALPKGATIDQLSRGLDGFAVEPEAVLSAFNDFLKDAAQQGMAIGKDLTLYNYNNQLVVGSRIELDTLTGQEEEASKLIQELFQSIGASTSQLESLEDLAWDFGEPEDEDLQLAVTAALTAINQPIERPDVGDEAEFDGSHTGVYRLADAILSELRKEITERLNSQDTPSIDEDPLRKLIDSFEAEDRKVYKVSRAATVYANLVKTGAVSPENYRLGEFVQINRSNPGHATFKDRTSTAYVQSVG
jgi:hypothetical protein